MQIELRAIAHTRSGDKGDISNIAVIAYEPAFYPLLRDQLTAERFRAYYKGVVLGRVTRYDVARLGVLNFVAEGALGGGVSRSLRLDQYGKTLSAGILSFPIELPDHLADRLRPLPSHLA